MFSIGFSPEASATPNEDGFLQREGVIVLDDFRESFVSPLGFWTEADYERQWRDGAQRIAEGARESCLVTWMDDPDTEPFLRWWSLYRQGERAVIVREQLWLPEFGSVDPASPWASVRPYEPDPEISEWSLTLEDFAAFAAK